MLRRTASCPIYWIGATQASPGDPFAVVHDIDARRELTLHHVVRRHPHGVVKFMDFVWIIPGGCRERPQLRRADDAADMGREDTVVAASHSYSWRFSSGLAAP